MRLIIIAPLVVTEEAGVRRWNANYGRLIDGLAAHFRIIEVLAATPSRDDATYYPDGKSLYRYSTAAPNINLTPIPISLPTDGAFQKALAWLRRVSHYWRAIRRADIAYITMPGLSSLMACALCRLQSRPYILYYGSDWVSLVPFMTRWGSKDSLLQSIYRRVADWAEGVPVRRSLFTLATGHRLQQRLGRFGPRVFETRPMLAIGPDDFFERLDTCGGPGIHVVYAGALLPRKGVHILIDAIGELHQRGIPVHLTLAGAEAPAYTSKLRHDVARKDLADRVTFTGFIPEIADLLRLYRSGDLFVLPTLSEGFPRVLYEAMSQSLPVVATAIPAITASVEDGQQALLVPPGSSPALAEAIARIATEPDLRRRLIQKGFAFASARLTGDSTAQQIMGLLHKFRADMAGPEGLRQWAETYYSHSEEYQQRLASKWDEAWTETFREYVDAVLSAAPPTGRILDLGCGGGQTSWALAAGHRTVGADFSLAALRDFPKDRQSPDLSLVNCDAAFLPFRRESFHSAGSYTMLEHLPDVEKALEELDRVLVPGETLVLCGPNMLSPFHAARLWWDGIQKRRNHPDGTLATVLTRSWLTLRKMLSRRPRFLYRAPLTQGLEFAGSDYDAIALVNPYDLLHWLRRAGYLARNRPRGRGRTGRLLAKTLPNLSGGVCVVARKPRELR